MSASNWGQKCKSNVKQSDNTTSSNHDEHPPAKKEKALFADKPQTQPVPHPTKKIPPGSQQEKLTDCQTAKKQTSDVADVAAVEQTLDKCSTIRHTHVIVSHDITGCGLDHGRV